VDAQLGLEETPEAYVAALVAVFREVRRVLADSGTLWLNLGDSYNNRAKVRETSHQPALNDFTDDVWADRAARGGVRMSLTSGGMKEKDLVGIPWRVAFALQADGWYLRSDIIWSKPNPMPESVTDRPTKAHEYVFLLSKSPRYFFDQEAVREPHSPDGRTKTVHDHATPRSHANYDNVGNGNERWPNGGRNLRSVWTIATQPYADAHFAVFPEELVRRCLLAGCPEGGTVLDPFGGSGTTALVAREHNRRAVLIELNETYCALAARRLQQLSLLA
jgi:site-specific DNA-methyltransferase (adenine-specific)